MEAAEASPCLVEPFLKNFTVVIADSFELISEAMRLRYQVYCVERDYENPGQNPGGYERDQFDARSVHALIRHNQSGACVGSVRLILADRVDSNLPFPIESRCGGGLPPGAATRLRGVPRARLAEISRFAVTKEFRRRYTEAEHKEGISPLVKYFDPQSSAALHRRAMPYVTIGLFAAIVRLSILHGVSHWLAVMEPSLIRLLTRFGIHFDPIGPIIEYHGSRQPALATGAEVAARARRERRDVWRIVTEDGRFVPPHWPLNHEGA
jgi:N-acyl amino acid synthase of PEP-CTERM/exosortase system